MDSGSDSENLPFDISEELVQPRQRKAAGTQDFDLDGLLQPPLKLHEDVRNGNGGQVWPAGMTLATYLLRVKRDDIVGKSILELGAGAGIVSLALAQSLQHQAGGCSSTHITMTDQPPMLDLMRQNLVINELSPALIDAAVLDWGTTEWTQNQPDILLAADCVYFEPAFPLLLKTMKELIGPGTVCYFCMKKRRKADMRFIKDMKKTFLVVDVEDDPNKSTWTKEAIMLYRVTARAVGEATKPSLI